MKSRWESAEVFGKYAELEVIDYMIRQEHRRLNVARPKAAIDVMIDAATGFGASQDLDSIDTIKDLVQQRIECEKFLEMDSSNAEEFLNRLTELEEKLEN